MVCPGLDPSDIAVCLDCCGTPLSACRSTRRLTEPARTLFSLSAYRVWSISGRTAGRRKVHRAYSGSALLDCPLALAFFFLLATGGLCEDDGRYNELEGGRADAASATCNGTVKEAEGWRAGLVAADATLSMRGNGLSMSRRSSSHGKRTAFKLSILNLASISSDNHIGRQKDESACLT